MAHLLIIKHGFPDLLEKNEKIYGFKDKSNVVSK